MVAHSSMASNFHRDHHNDRSFRSSIEYVVLQVDPLGGSKPVRANRSISLCCKPIMKPNLFVDA